MKIKINKYSIIMCFILIMLPLSSIIKIPFLQYIDELATIYLLGIIISNKKNNNDYKLIITLITIIIIGIISNIFSDIKVDRLVILCDILLISKTFVVYLGAKKVFESKVVLKNTISILTPISKIFILISFIFGVLNLLFDIGMNNGTRYGLRSYCFIFNQPAHFGLFISGALAIIILKEKNDKKYEVMALACMFFTTKGMVIIIMVVYIFMGMFSNKINKVRWYHLLVLIPILLYVGQYQINGYILNDSAPRARLIKYGFTTAVDYFPLGAGFATYGSEMAARYYSDLYIYYGFDSIKGLSSWYPIYLNDNYMATIIGQFGFLGLITHIYGLLIIWTDILKKQYNNKKNRNICIAMMSSLSAIFIASGSYKNVVGLYMFIIISMLINSGDI